MKDVLQQLIERFNTKRTLFLHSLPFAWVHIFACEKLLYFRVAIE